MKENVVYDKAYQFAIKIVQVYQYLVKEKKEYLLAKQVLRSGTSIGANISEANDAISKADFSNKISLAYKECLETKYWISLLRDSNLVSKETFQ
jgi:four helix bundle protein